MPRTTTAQQDIDLAALAYNVHTIVEVQNADGTWIDLTDDPVNSLDWLIRGEVEEDTDRPVIQATVTFRRDREGTSSLSPTREDSPLNVDDSAVYAPLIDPGRGMRVSVAVVGSGVATVPGDFQQIFLGIIDSFDAGEDPIKVVARDAIGAELADTFVEARTSFGTEAGRAVELVMQDILDAFAPSITLLVPAVPGFAITPYTLDGISVHRALLSLAAKIGYVVRVRWDDGVSDWRLVLEEPDRTRTVPDWTFGPKDYYKITRFAINRLPIRNYIDIQKSGDVLAFAQDAVSQARFGRRYLRITEADDSPIDTVGEAQVMADAALADIKDPDAEQEVDGRLFWPIQVRDLVRFTANASQYNVDQDLAVFGYRHVLENGGGHSFLRVRGKPAGMYRYWLQLHNNQELEDATKRETVFSDSEPSFVMVRAVDAGNNPGFFLDVHFDMGPDANSYYITAAFDDGAPQSSDEHIIAGVAGEKGIVRITSGAGSPQFFLDSHTEVEVSFTPKAAKIVFVTGEPPIGGKRSTFRPIEKTLDEGEVGARATVTGSGTVHATDLLQFRAADFTIALVAGRPEVRTIATGASLGSLTDVTLTAEGSGDYLRHNGSVWVNVTGVAAADLTGVVGVAQGGTGLSSPAADGLLITHGASVMTVLDSGATAGYVRSNGATWLRVTGVPATDLTGTVGVGNAGTGVVDPTSGNLLIGAGGSAMTQLAFGAAAGYVRSTGSAWTRNSGVPAADVTADVFGTGDYRFPSDLNVQTRLAVGTATIPPNLVAGDILADNGVFATNDFGAGNIDHIWHDDSVNIWHLVSDGARKAVGQSRLRLGLGTVGSCVVQIGDVNTGIFGPSVGIVGLASDGVEHMRVDNQSAGHGRVRFTECQVYVVEGALITRSTAGSVTLDWDAYNQVPLRNDGNIDTILIDDASMQNGFQGTLIIRMATGGQASITFTATGTLRRQNGSDPTLPLTVGNRTTVTFLKSEGLTVMHYSNAT